MKEELLNIGNIPAVLYGDKSDTLYLYVHGKHGYKEEAAAFANIVCPTGQQVLAIDLPGHGARQNTEPSFDPWHVVPELQAVMNYAKKHWAQVALRATSIGAWFSMLAFMNEPLQKALFVSPVLDMECLIRNMMLWAGVDESQLETEREIATDFGETLSWRYLQYAKAHPIAKWSAATSILYPGRDNLTERTVADAFVRRFGCELTVMEEGEHWFHTPEQLDFLRGWETAQML